MREKERARQRQSIFERETIYDLYFCERQRVSAIDALAMGVCVCVSVSVSVSASGIGCGTGSGAAQMGVGVSARYSSTCVLLLALLPPGLCIFWGCVCVGVCGCVGV